MSKPVIKNNRILRSQQVLNALIAHRASISAAGLAEHAHPRRRLPSIILENHCVKKSHIFRVSGTGVVRKE
jgi:hypothetical protein